jgi:GntR family transcriptional regulator/MocR family aminotransferase
VVEDDYDGEFQYGASDGTASGAGTVQPAAGQSVCCTSARSPRPAPGLRLGFMVLPPALVPAFAMARAMADRHAPGDAQAVLARFIAEGHLLRHLRRMRELYLRRQRVLIDALASATEGAVQLTPAEQGMHLLLEARAGRSDLAVTARAQQAGVVLAPLSRYTIESRRRGWLFGYAGYDDAALRSAAQCVAGLLFLARS